ncbi:hypothetical protein SNE40_011844 [Patella caerulea]|uniref:RGS domain-containing protein n=1 Tax=Patella caerulea TaxID=87958 RepID=A0AAN8JP62_PATCE
MSCILRDRRFIHTVLKPPEIKDDDIEDFLATDELFVEYFNTFLSLPSFPEPLCFNEETGGFEVVNNAKKDLARQIKAAVRSQQKKKKMYKVAKDHSYIDIPLIPIEEIEGPEKIEIDTTFTVTTLNKEQGIHWVKAERLPAFLESDCYLEYRLAKILSQARLTSESGEFVIMKIDFRPRIKKVKPKPTEDEDPNDPKERIMKDMFVSLGTVNTTDSSAWFSQAQNAQSGTQTFTTLSRPLSSSRPTSSRPISGRPKSVISAADSYRRPDSGFGSPMKSSVFSSSFFGSYAPGVNGTEELDDTTLRTKIYLDSKPITPRPSDACCVLTGDQNVVKKPAGPVYSYPKHESTDSESGVGDTDRDETDFETEVPTTYIHNDVQYQVESESETKDNQSETKEKPELSETKQNSTESIVVNNIDDLGSVIVGAILKRSLSEITNKPESEFENNKEILSIFSNPELSYITLEMLDHVCFNEARQGTEEQEEEIPVNKDLEKEEESDVDSLLDSEEDYEESDEFFRKHKIKTYDLSHRKGVQQFKTFLKGTSGEKYFKFWVDIDRSHLFPKTMDVLGYLAGMRDKYQRTSAPYELTKELKIELGLIEPSQWTVKKLQSLQNKIAEPLVTYWAPRFLLKQLMKTNPEKYYLYHHQQLLKQTKTDVNPNPPTKSLLPLRPKSCQPRIHTTPIIQDAVTVSYNPPANTFQTSPTVGMRRSYFHLQPKRPTTTGNMKTRTEYKKKPREFLEPRLRVPPNNTKRCQSAFTRTSSARLKPSHIASARPTSAGSSSSNESWESASVIMLPETPEPSNIILPSPPRSRPATRETTRRESKVSIESEFLGGQRMEALLQALENEKSAGGFFRKYIERSENKLWKCCFEFWLDVQIYHNLFYQETVEPYKLRVKSQAIYSKYIVTSSPCDIQCNNELRGDIYYHLSPPYEELFDEAEEYCLQVLYSAWIGNLKEDIRTYNKVELIDVKRHLETKSNYVLHLQRRGIIKERVLTPDDPMGGYEDPVYDPSLLDKIPEEFIDLSLEKLIHNRIELEHFRDFLAENYASMDLLCWMEIEAWRRISHTDEKKRDQKAKEIKTKYLNKKYFFGPNSPAGKEGQEKVMNAGGGWGKLLEDRPPNAVILEAQKYVRERLEKKWFPLFLTTDDFADRQRLDESMADVVDDVLVQKRKRSQAVWKLLESRWTSSSKEIVTIRKALLNPVTSHQFRRYVSIKGDNLENNVLFWQEVQKYKEMYHAHSDDGLIAQKINAIINCFIDSQIPPSIQIDIPHDMAEKILDRKHERGPYLFREAQLAVFRVLSGHWTSFCEFRSNLADDKILPTIERQRRHAKKKELKKQQEMEERMEKVRRETEAKGDVYVDPFKKFNEESVVDEEDYQEKDRMTWTYSNYMKALDEEDIMNNTNESIFSSVTDLSTDKDTPQQPLQRSTSVQSISEQTTVAGRKTTTRSDDNTTISKSSNGDNVKEGKSENRELPSPTSGSGKVKFSKVEQTTSAPSIKEPTKPSSPPVSKPTSETKHVRYSRAMPPLVKPREK